MATKKKAKRKSENELLENPEALAQRLSKSEEWLEKNKILVYGILGVIALAIAGMFFYTSNLDSQNETAQSEMFQAQYWFESDSLDLALNGDGNFYGFLEIIDNYGSTKAGNLSKFYAGACYLKQGDFDQAIEYLNSFSSGDVLVQGRAYALLGDANLEKGNFEEAADFYGKAAEYNPNEFFSPDYLIKQAIAYEESGDYANAVAAYDIIIKQFSTSNKIQVARKHRARVETLASK